MLSFHWNTSCEMMEPIGSLVHWNLTMSNAIVVNFLDSGCSSTIQQPLLKSAIVNLSHAMEFSKYFLNGSGVVWFPFQSLIQIPRIQANLGVFFCDEWSSVLESAGTFFSTITRLFTHSVTSLTGSKIPSHSKFLISLWKASCRCTGMHLGGCLASFAFGFSWNLYGDSGNILIPVNMSEYTLRMSCFFSGMP